MILELIQFPIKGPFRGILLVIEWMIVFFFSELAFFFFRRVKKQKKEIRILQYKPYILIFLGWSIMWVFYILGDFYAESRFIRLLIFNIGYVVRIIIGLRFSYMMEKNQIYFKKFLFTKTYAIMLLITIILFFVAVEYTQIVSLFLFWLPFVLFFLVYMIKLGSNPQFKQTRKIFKVKYSFSIVGFVFITLGFGGTSDPMLGLLGWNIRLIGDILQLIGVGILTFYFSSIPSLIEYEWQDKIDTLFVMVQSGICIYKKNFKKQLEEDVEQGITGALASMKIVLEQLINKKGKSRIEKMGKVILIHPGQLITGIIIADEYLRSLEFLLDKFIRRIETIYFKILEKWGGEMEIFEPIEDMAKEIFF